MEGREGWECLSKEDVDCEAGQADRLCTSSRAFALSRQSASRPPCLTMPRVAQTLLASPEQERTVDKRNDRFSRPGQIKRTKQKLTLLALEVSCISGKLAFRTLLNLIRLSCYWI